ncbi:MAG: hypothetical protein GX241_01600 [Ruminococcaceae bacterium]|nr:hypothetical protein [Oscillospiraceae bacterium]
MAKEKKKSKPGKLNELKTVEDPKDLKEQKNIENFKKQDELEELISKLPGEVILDLNDSEDDKIPLDPETGLDPEELEKELEDLKDLVQDEIDKMMEENPESEWDDIVKEAADKKLKRTISPSVKMCDCCGDVEVDEDEIYCEMCLETMQHYPFEGWKALIPIITIALLALSFSLTAISWSVFSSTAKAEKFVREGKFSSALAMYDSINTEIKVTDRNFGQKYLYNQVRIYDKIGIEAYEQLNVFIEENYTAKNLDNPCNKKVKNIKLKIDNFGKLYEIFELRAYSASSYEAFEKAFDEDVAKDEYDSVFVNYFKYVAATFLDESTESKNKIIDKIREADPDFKSLYLSLYAETALDAKDYDKCIAYANDLQKTNAESAYPYVYKAIAYRLKGDIAKASNACNEGLKVAPMNSNMNYQMAVVCLLQGKNETAFTYAELAFNNATDMNTFESAGNLYALCSGLKGDKEKYESAVEALKYYNISLSKDVTEVLEGNKKVEDIFAKGKGDFTWG